jgi:ABC-type lipoprotein release transport system permease subunit
MLSLKLAFRNIFANRQRSLVIYIAITLICTVLFLFLSFSDGEIENFTRGIEGLRNPPADFVVSHWITCAPARPARAPNHSIK